MSDYYQYSPKKLLLLNSIATQSYYALSSSINTFSLRYQNKREFEEAYKCYSWFRNRLRFTTNTNKFLTDLNEKDFIPIRAYIIEYALGKNPAHILYDLKRYPKRRLLEKFTNSSKKFRKSDLFEEIEKNSFEEINRISLHMSLQGDFENILQVLNQVRKKDLN